VSGEDYITKSLMICTPIKSDSGDEMGEACRACVGAWTGLIWLRIGTGGGSFKSSNEPSGSIKCGDFLDYIKEG